MELRAFLAKDLRDEGPQQLTTTGHGPQTTGHGLWERAWIIFMLIPKESYVPTQFLSMNINFPSEKNQNKYGILKFTLMLTKFKHPNTFLEVKVTNNYLLVDPNACFSNNCLKKPIFGQFLIQQLWCYGTVYLLGFGHLCSANIQQCSKCSSMLIIALECKANVYSMLINAQQCSTMFKEGTEQQSKAFNRNTLYNSISILLWSNQEKSMMVHGTHHVPV